MAVSLIMGMYGRDDLDWAGLTVEEARARIDDAVSRDITGRVVPKLWVVPYVNGVEVPWDRVLVDGDDVDLRFEPPPGLPRPRRRPTWLHRLAWRLGWRA